MNWMINALCRDAADPELWFPVTETGPGADQVARAKAECARCPVTGECLSFALAAGLDYGVFGGTSATERREMSRVR
jgi:WhiB family transcriptional regulator, redox-sensing transcriptional regulator